MEQVSQSRSASYAIRHNSSPYLSPKQGYSAFLYQPDAYTLTVILSQPARALRVLFMLAARYNPATGMSHCSKLEMKKFLSGKRCNLFHATGDLIDARLVAKGQETGHVFYQPEGIPTLHHRIMTSHKRNHPVRFFGQSCKRP